MASQYPDGVWFVELAPLTDSSLVAHQIGAVVGVRETTGEELADTIARALSGRRTLLLLDNCEHVLDLCAQAIERILRGQPPSEFWPPVASRSVLPAKSAGASRRLRYPPSGICRRASIAPRSGSFVERATAGQPEFALTEANAPAIGQVCRRLDGIPLALELAAARLGVLTAQQLAMRLDQRFRLLTGGRRTALARQQTLQATMDWSYKLLTPAERRLFEQLSVFAGRFSLAGAEQVCVSDGLTRDGILDLVGALFEKSLVMVDDCGHGEDRFAYPESVREYAGIKLASRGTARSSAVHHRHADVLRGPRRKTESGRDGSELLHLAADVTGLERERDNVRAALGWCVENGRAALGLRIAIRVEPYWFARGMFGEGRQWFDALLGLADAGVHSDTSPEHGDDVVAPLQRAWALGAAAAVFGNQGNSVRALASAEECVAILADLAPLSPNYAYALGHLGISVWITGDVDRAIALHQEALRLGRALRAETIIAEALRNLGRIALCQGRYEDAVELFEQSLASASGGWWNTNGRAMRLPQLGRAHYGRGAYDEAATAFREARRSSKPTTLAVCPGRLSRVAGRAGDRPGRTTDRGAAVRGGRGGVASKRQRTVVTDGAWLSTRCGTAQSATRSSAAADRLARGCEVDGSGGG